MHADAEAHLTTFGAIRVFLCNRVLDRDSALDRVDGAGEIRNNAIAGGIENPSAVAGNQSIEDRPVRLQRAQRANLVQPHQAAVLGNIGRKDCGKLSFDYLAFCHRPS
jgi:hypothetical protein